MTTRIPNGGYRMTRTGVQGSVCHMRATPGHQLWAATSDHVECGTGEIGILIRDDAVKGSSSSDFVDDALDALDPPGVSHYYLCDVTKGTTVPPRFQGGDPDGPFMELDPGVISLRQDGVDVGWVYTETVSGQQVEHWILVDDFATLTSGESVTLSGIQCAGDATEQAYAETIFKNLIAAAGSAVVEYMKVESAKTTNENLARSFG